jgi:hypothetical protein
MAMRRGLVGLLLSAGAVAVLSTVPAGAQEDPALPATDAGDVAVATSLPPTTLLPATTSLPPTTEAAPAAAAPATVAPASAPTTVAGTTPPVTAPVALSAQQECLPNYPDFCIPPGQDVNCEDIDAANFTVIGGDPYGLDNGGVEGVACEDVPAATAVTPVPTTPPSQVAGAGAAGAAQTTTLPVTGARSTMLAVLGFVVLALGVAFISIGGHLANPLTGRLRGGFTYTHTNSAGQVIVQRVTTSRRR